MNKAILSSISEQEIQRFWSHVDKTPDTGCWIYRSPRNGKHVFGYRFFYTNKVGICSHRVSWHLVNGPIPDDMQVLHNCPTGDNPACCNPAHLFLGTQKDNVRDCVKKGRFRRGDIKGSKNPFSILKDADVVAIRAAYATGSRQVDLAAQFNICRQGIWAIVHGRAWQHI